MGQVPHDLKPADEIPAVEAEVDVLRERTEALVAELERRLRARATRARETIDEAKDKFEHAKEALEHIKRAANLKRQMREHPELVIGVSSAAAIALGLGVYAVVHRIIERRRPANRLRRRAQALRTILADPERALRPREPIGRRLVTAMLVASAATIVKGLSAIMVKRAVAPRLLSPGEAETVVIKS